MCALGNLVDGDPFKPLIMIIGRTKLAFDHCGAFEIVAYSEFLRDPNAAMRLDRVLADKLRAA